MGGIGGQGLIGSTYLLEASQYGHIVGQEFLHLYRDATAYFATTLATCMIMGRADEMRSGCCGCEVGSVWWRLPGERKRPPGQIGRE